MTDSHLEQLASGFDFFEEAFGADMAAMQAAWADAEVRTAVRQRAGELWPGEEVWAEVQFGPVH